MKYSQSFKAILSAFTLASLFFFSEVHALITYGEPCDSETIVIQFDSTVVDQSYQFFNLKQAVYLPTTSFDTSIQTTSCPPESISIVVSASSSLDDWFWHNSDKNRIEIYDAEGRAAETVTVTLTASLPDHQHQTTATQTFQIVGTPPSLCEDSMDAVTIGAPTSATTATYVQGSGDKSYSVASWTVNSYSCTVADLTFEMSCSSAPDGWDTSVLQYEASGASGKVIFEPTEDFTEQVVFTCTVTASLTRDTHGQGILTSNSAYFSNDLSAYIHHRLDGFDAQIDGVVDNVSCSDSSTCKWGSSASLSPDGSGIQYDAKLYSPDSSINTFNDPSGTSQIMLQNSKYQELVSSATLTLQLTVNPTCESSDETITMSFTPTTTDLSLKTFQVRDTRQFQTFTFGLVSAWCTLSDITDITMDVAAANGLDTSWITMTRKDSATLEVSWQTDDTSLATNTFVVTITASFENANSAPFTEAVSFSIYVSGCIDSNTVITYAAASNLNYEYYWTLDKAESAIISFAFVTPPLSTDACQYIDQQISYTLTSDSKPTKDMEDSGDVSVTRVSDSSEPASYKLDWYFARVFKTEMTYTFTVTSEIQTSSTQTYQQSIVLTLNIKIPTCEMAKENRTITVPGSGRSVDYKFYGAAGVFYVEPDLTKLKFGFSDSDICEVSDFTVVTDISATWLDDYWTYIRHQNYDSIANTYDFAGGLPMEYWLYTSLPSETITITIYVSSYSPYHGYWLEKSVTWYLKVEQITCPESFETITFAVHDGFWGDDAKTVSVPDGDVEPVDNYWAINEVIYQPEGGQFNRVYFDRIHVVDLTTVYFLYVCDYQDIEMHYSLETELVPESEYREGSFIYHDVHLPSSLNSDANAKGYFEWSYDELTVYDEVIFKLTIWGTADTLDEATGSKITQTSPTITYRMLVTPPPCFRTPEDVQIEARLPRNLQKFTYNLEQTDLSLRSVQYTDYTEFNSYACNNTDIQYTFQVTPPISEDVILFDNKTLTFSWFSNNREDEKFYEVDLIGTIHRTPRWGNVQGVATFQLIIYQKCNNPATQLTEYNEIYMLNYKAGDADQILLVKTFYFADSEDQSCWQEEWVYRLENKLDKDEEIPVNRDESKAISYSFDPQTRVLQFYADAETESVVLYFYLYINRQSGDLVKKLPVTINVFDKATEIPANVLPNQHSPILKFGTKFNQTVVNLQDLDVGYLDLGPASDEDQTSAEPIDIFSQITPPTKHIRFNKVSGLLLFDLIDLVSAARVEQLEFDVKIILTDSNFFPRSSTYFLTIIVPLTPLEDVENNQAYQDALSDKFSSIFDKVVSKPGEIDRLSIDSNGLLTITFTEPLPNDKGAFSIAKDFIIIKLYSNTETDEALKSFTVEVLEATKSKIIYQILFLSPGYISDQSNKNLDELEITILKPLYQQKYTKIPKQNVNAQQAEQIRQVSEAMQVGSTTIIATTLVTNLLLRASISQLWGMINAIQVIAYLTLLNGYFPQNMVDFFDFLLDLSEFDILPIDDINEFLFPFISDMVDEQFAESVGRLLQKKGSGARGKVDDAESDELTPEEAKKRLGMIFLFVLIGILIPIMIITYCLRRRYQVLNTVFKTLYFGLFFNQSARFVLESYTPLMQTQLENLNRGLNFDSSVYAILSINDLFFTAIYGLFPLTVTIYFYRSLRYFKKKWFLAKWGDIMSNLSWRRQSSSFFVAIFCYRRLAAALLVVLLKKQVWAQITLSIYINQTVVICLGLASPFKYRSDRLLELFNEVNIMICSYHIFLFSDFLPDPTVRSQMGVSMIVFTSISFFVNIGILLYSTLRETTRQYKMKSTRYKKVQKQKLKQAFNVDVPISKEELEKKVIYDNMDRANDKVGHHVENAIKQVHLGIAPIHETATARAIRLENEEAKFQQEKKELKAKMAEIRKDTKKLNDIRKREYRGLEKIEEVDEISILSISDIEEELNKIGSSVPKNQMNTARQPKQRDPKHLQVRADGVYDQFGDKVDLDNLRGFDKNDVFDRLMEFEEKKAKEEDIF